MDAWNTWYDWYGNTPEGFAARNAEISAACERAGRDPAEVERSACVLVVLDAAAGERPVTAEAPPVEGSMERIADAPARARRGGRGRGDPRRQPDHERSIRALGEALALL